MIYEILMVPGYPETLHAEPEGLIGQRTDVALGLSVQVVGRVEADTDAEAHAAGLFWFGDH